MSVGRVFVVTSEWLKAQRTTRGAYTRQQLALLGVEWPPRNGWKASAIGSRITAAGKAQFEALAQTGRRAATTQ